MEFNSKQYAWVNIEVAPFGQKMAGCRGVKYKKSQEKEAVYGAGSMPHSIQPGNVTIEGELSMLQSTLENILEVARATLGSGASLTDIPPFDLPVSYKPKFGGQIVTDVIKFAEFTELEKGMSQGDKFMEITVPFVALDIQYGV